MLSLKMKTDFYKITKGDVSTCCFSLSVLRKKKCDSTLKNKNVYNLILGVWYEVSNKLKCSIYRFYIHGYVLYIVVFALVIFFVVYIDAFVILINLTSSIWPSILLPVPHYVISLFAWASPSLKQTTRFHSTFIICCINILNLNNIFFVNQTHRYHSSVLWNLPGTHSGTHWAPCWCRSRRSYRAGGCHSSLDLRLYKIMIKLLVYL